MARVWILLLLPLCACARDRSPHDRHEAPATEALDAGAEDAAQVQDSGATVSATTLIACEGDCPQGECNNASGHACGALFDEDAGAHCASHPMTSFCATFSGPGHPFTTWDVAFKCNADGSPSQLDCHDTPCERIQDTQTTCSLL